MKGSREMIPVLLLLLAVFITFPDIISGRRVLFRRELRYLHYPYFRYTVDEVSSGRVPLWTRLVFCGYPVIANVQLGLLYPLNLVFFTGSVAGWMNALIVLHFLLGILGMYAFARERGLSYIPALVAGLVFGLNGFVLSKYVEIQSVRTMFWLPLVLLFISRSKSRPSNLITAGVLHCLAFLGGMLQYWYYQNFIVIGWGIYQWAKDGWRKSLYGVATGGVVLLVAVVLVSVQLAPSYELSRQSARVNLSYQGAVAGEGNNFSARELVESVLPDAFGRKGAFVPVFLGVLAVSLCLGGLRDWRRAGFFWGCFVFFALLSAGKYTPFFKALYTLGLPGFRMFHDPIRAFYGVAFSVAMLSGFGVERFRWKDSLVALISVLILILLASHATKATLRGSSTLIALLQTSLLSSAVYLHRRREALAKLILCAGVFIGFWFEAWRVVPRDEPSVLSRTEKWDLPKELMSTRIFDTDPDDMRLSRWLIPGVESTSGYATLAPQRLLYLSGARLDFVNPIRHNLYQSMVYDRRVLTLTATRYVIADRKADLSSIPHLVRCSLSKGIIEGEPLSKYAIYEVLGTAPHSYIARSVKVAEDPLREIIKSNSELGCVAILEKPAPELRTSNDDSAMSALLSAQRCIFSGTGLLVMNDSYYPGWRAFSEGKEVEIFRANFAFRASPSEGLLDVAYEPPSFKYGLFGTLVAVLFICGIVGASELRRKDTNPTNSF